MTNEEMLRYAHVLPLFKWTIVTSGPGEQRAERVFIAPRAEDAIAMFRACNHFATFFEVYGCGLIMDMRCEYIDPPPKAPSDGE